MKLDIKLQGFDKLQTQLAKLGSKGLKEAAALALNDAAFKVRKDMKSELQRVFDRPTPYILSSPYVRKATPDRLEAIISPTYMGGKGVDPQKILAAHITGGRRTDKRSEVALRRAGVLPNGYQTAIPADPYPGSHDGRGNIKGSFIVRLLSYFAAFGEQGYRANATSRSRSRLAKMGRTASGYKTINGVLMFVSYGRLRGQHLAPGIWAKSGIHGSNVRPVLMFVKTGTYTRRLSMEKIAAKSNLQSYFERRMRYQMRTLLGE